MANLLIITLTLVVSASIILFSSPLALAIFCLIAPMVLIAVTPIILLISANH